MESIPHTEISVKSHNPFSRIFGAKNQSTSTSIKARRNRTPPSINLANACCFRNKEDENNTHEIQPVLQELPLRRFQNAILGRRTL